MHGSEELLTDEGYRQLNGNLQYELIMKSCADIEDRIRSASSESDAARIAETSCARIEETCQSALIRTALRTNVKNLLLRYWKRLET